jgi:hypothetical protein
MDSLTGEKKLPLPPFGILQVGWRLHKHEENYQKAIHENTSGSGYTSSYRDSRQSLQSGRLINLTGQRLAWVEVLTEPASRTVPGP